MNKKGTTDKQQQSMAEAMVAVWTRRHRGIHYGSTVEDQPLCGGGGRRIVYGTMVEAEEQLPCGDKREAVSQSQSGHGEWRF